MQAIDVLKHYSEKESLSLDDQITLASGFLSAFSKVDPSVFAVAAADFVTTVGLDHSVWFRAVCNTVDALEAAMKSGDIRTPADATYQSFENYFRALFAEEIIPDPPQPEPPPLHTPLVSSQRAAAEAVLKQAQSGKTTQEKPKSPVAVAAPPSPVPVAPPEVPEGEIEEIVLTMQPAWRNRIKSFLSSTQILPKIMLGEQLFSRTFEGKPGHAVLVTVENGPGRPMLMADLLVNGVVVACMSPRTDVPVYHELENKGVRYKIVF